MRDVESSSMPPVQPGPADDTESSGPPPDPEVRIGLEHHVTGWQRVFVGVLAVLSVPTAVLLVVVVDGWWSKITWAGVMAFGCWILFSSAFRMTVPLRWHRRLEKATGASSDGLGGGSPLPDEDHVNTS